MYKRITRALQVLWNDGVLVEFNSNGKKAVLIIKELPTEGDSITCAGLTAEWKANNT